MLTRSRGALVAACSTLLLSGCFKSYVVASFQAPPPPASVAEVTAAPRFAEVRPTIRTVTVRAPSACRAAPPAAAHGAGVAALSRTIFETRCGVWIAELERALGARYRVVSWRDLADAEREAGAVHLAAQRLGADAVLVVEDLAPAPLLVSELGKGTVTLRQARPDGTETGPAALSPSGEQAILALVNGRYRDGAVGGLVADVEVTAIATTTGEPLWTYRRHIAAGLAGALDSRMLLRGRGRRWRPVAPRLGNGGPAAAAAVDPVQARVTELAGAVAADLVQRFTTGR